MFRNLYYLVTFYHDFLLPNSKYLIAVSEITIYLGDLAGLRDRASRNAR